MPRFIEAFWNRGFLCFQRHAEVARFEGIALADIRETSSHFRNTYLAALKLVRDHDPLRFARVQRHIQWIFNCHLPLIMAEYDAGTRTCRVNFEEPPNEADLQLWIGFGACTLIHETTHAIVHAHGIRYVPELRARIERVCVTEENRFVAKLAHAQPGKGSNRRLEFELGAWFEGACGFALVLALSQMMVHGLGPFGSADLHPRRNPLDRQGRFAPQPGSDGQLAGVAAPASGQLGLLPAPSPRLERFLVESLQPAPFHLPLELLTPRCAVLPNAVLAQQAAYAPGAQHEPNHVRPPPASQTPKTASPPLPPLSGRFTRTNLRFDPFPPHTPAALLRTY